MLRDFLNYWLLSVPMSGDLSAEQMLAAARLPLAKLHPTARAFWQAYCTSAKIGALAAGVFWRRSLCFAAANSAFSPRAYFFRPREPTTFGLLHSLMRRFELRAGVHQGMFSEIPTVFPEVAPDA